MAKQTVNIGTVADDGTGDSLRVAFDKLNDNCDELYAFRGGALVYRSSDQTAANYASGATIPWNAETYDTASIHDLVTNTSRLTVPAGVTRVRVVCSVVLGNVTGATDVFAAFQKNGAIFVGGSSQMCDTSNAFPRFSMSSAVVSVTAGDYFEVFFSTGGDTSIDVKATESWFALEIIE